MSTPARALILVVAVAASFAAPGVAGAANRVVVPGAQASKITALDGTLVWVTGRFPDQLLMQRTPDGRVGPVRGAPRASYFSLDLGHDSRGGLVLTYARCVGTKRCRVISDDLAGRRATFKRLASNRCSLTTAPSRWRTRVAYGLSCVKRRNGRLVFDARRSGLFVRGSAGRARQLALPPDAVRFGSNRVSWVDLRGGSVAAAVSGVYSYAFTQTVGGAALRADLVATSEGDSEASIRGLSLGTGGAMWTLVDAAHGGDPNIAIISRILGTGCTEQETLVNPPGPAEGDGYVAEAMAVDGATAYVYVPPIGIVAHDFAPARPCG
jgi:hypothetical protein